MTPCMHDLVDRLKEGEYVPVIEECHSIINRITSGQHTPSIGDCRQLWNHMVNFKNSCPAESLSASGRKAQCLVHEVVCAGLRSKCEQGHVDNSTILFYCEALLTTADELSRSSENDKGKGRLYFDTAKAVIEKCKACLMNIMEDRQYSYLQARYIILCLGYDRESEDSIIANIATMKPAVVELLSRAVCEFECNSDFHNIILKITEAILIHHHDSLLDITKCSVLNKQSETFIQAGRHAEATGKAKMSFQTMPNMDAVFWYCKSEAMLGSLDETAINMVNACLQFTNFGGPTLDKVLIILEKFVGFEKIASRLIDNELTQAALLKVIMSSDKITVTEKASRLLSSQVNVYGSEDILLSIEKLYEDIFANHEYELAMKLLDLLGNLFNPEDDNFGHNTGVLIRKKVDCLMASGDLKEAENIINKHSPTEACWVVRAFTLRLLRGQFDLAEMCFDQLLTAKFHDECLFCVSSAQSHNQREFSLRLLTKYISHRHEKCEPLAAKSFISLSCEFSSYRADTIETAFAILKREKKDLSWCMCASWSFVAMAMNNRDYSTALKMIKICQSFARKEVDCEYFILLYFELVCLLEVTGEEDRICVVLEKFTEKKEMIDNLGRSSVFNVSVTALLSDSAFLQYRIALYRKDYPCAVEIIRKTAQPSDILKLAKLTLTAKCANHEILTTLLNRVSAIGIEGRDRLFIVRCALLLLSDPRQSDVISNVAVLLDGQSIDGDDEYEEELIWIIVFMHNTALDLTVMQDWESAKRWSAAALRHCSKLSIGNQETYEKAVRTAFLSIIKSSSS